jgi:hypothetical protein
MCTYYRPYMPKMCDCIRPKWGVLTLSIWLQCTDSMGGSNLRTFKALSALTYGACLSELARKI